MIQYDEIRYSLNNAKPQLEELRVSLALDAAADELATQQEQAQAPDFWDNPENSQKVLQKHNRLHPMYTGKYIHKHHYPDYLMLLQSL